MAEELYEQGGEIQSKIVSAHVRNHEEIINSELKIRSCLFHSLHGWIGYRGCIYKVELLKALSILSFCGASSPPSLKATVYSYTAPATKFEKKKT